VEAERAIGRDNVVTSDQVALQLAQQPGRRTGAGLRVLVRRHLEGRRPLPGSLRFQRSTAAAGLTPVLFTSG
jgi:hypothetical protein